MKSAVSLLLPLGLFPPRMDSLAAKYLGVSRRRDPTKWGFPGGKVDPGETIEQAMLREVFEEVGLQISPEEVEPIYSDVCPGKGPEDTYWVTTYVWKRPAGPLTQSIQVEAGLVAAWCTERELTDPRSSPFAAYNVGAFNAYRRFLGQD